MKRVKIFCFAALLMVLAGLNGFASGNQQGGGRSSAGGGAAPAIDPNKKLSLSIAVWEVSPFGDDEIGKIIKEKLNLDAIDIIPLDWGTYETQIQLWATSNSLPEPTGAYPMSSSWFGEFVKQEIIKNIPYEMAAKYSAVKNLFDTNKTFLASKDIYQGNWYLPRPLSVTNYRVGDNPGIYYRKDWALKLGFTEEPTDMDYYYEMIKAFAKNDPDGNGQHDTYGSVGAVTSYYSFFDAFPWMWVNGPDGKVIPGYLNEKPMMEALLWLRRAYSEGVLDPELTTNANLVQEKFAQGLFGALSSRPVGAGWYNTIAVNQWGGVHTEQNALDDVHVIAAMSPHKGGTRFHIPATDSSGTLFPYNISDEKLDRLLALSQYCHTEGYRMLNLGFEGVDYEVNPDNTIKPLHETTTSRKYPSSTIQTYAFWTWDFGQFDSPFMDKAVQDYTTEWQKTANAMAGNVSVNLTANMMSTPEKLAYVFDYNRYLAEIITGTGDVKAMYDAMVRDAYANGVQNVVDSVNAAVGK